MLLFRERAPRISLLDNFYVPRHRVSRRDFAGKVGTVLKEAAETQYWIELLTESGIAKMPSATALHAESTELLAIFTTIGKRLRE